MNTTPRATLLFVDDEERIVNLLRMVFRADYEVFTATSGAEALQVLASRRVDVIVSDQRMPGMQGVELLAAVRERWPATMRILLTGYSDLAAIVGSVNEGAVYRFVSKPWDQQEMKGIIADAAEAAQHTRQHVLAAAEDSAFTTSAGFDDAPELLIVDDSAGDREALRRFFETDYQVHAVGTVGEALGVLEQRDIGVIVSEARVGGQDAGKLLRALKQHYPAITTVMLSRAADADLVIRLINQAQIYRFASKPIRSGPFQLAVSAAMREHKRLRISPSLLKRHRLARSTEPEDHSLVASVVKSLGGWRERFSRLVAQRAAGAGRPTHRH